MKHKFLFFAVIIFLWSSVSNAQYKSGLVEQNVAVFYPKDFDAARNLPSFCLAKEPKAIGEIPSTWKVKVQFEKAFNKSIAYIPVEENTDFYGTGEVTGSLVRNGTSIKLWNTDNYIYKSDNGQRLYQSHPWVLCVRKNGTAFGVLADNTWKQEISLGEGITFSSYGPAFRVFVIEGETPQEVVKKLSQMIGKIEMPPLWSLGFQQCRFSYFPDSRVKEIADSFRLKKIPCDVIWFDIDYMNEFRIFTFSPKNFPNPKATNDYLHAKGFKSVWMIDPGIKYDSAYFVFNEGTKLDGWVKNENGKPFIGKVWPGGCVFPDFTQPAVSNWWSGLYKKYMANGIDGVWNDMNEPSVFDGVDFTMPATNVHKGGGEIPKDVHLRYHNVYGMLMTKASRAGILNANPDKRPFVLTRSNFLGGQRYAATWTGDNTATWEHLKMSIPMCINLGLSGQPFNGPDIGGFVGNSSPDLFAHWMAIGTLFPFSRAHKSNDTKNHEPWSLGAEVENSVRTSIERRYRLLPYLYTLFYEAYSDGMPIMRPVFFADPQKLDLRTEQEIFLLGSDLLIIPKWAENPALPSGNWRTISLVGEDGKNDKYQPDLKIREGAIIPLAEIFQNTVDYNLDILTLYVSLDKTGKAAGNLYFDSGNGFEFKNGQFGLISFKAETKGNEVIVNIFDKKGNLNLASKVIKVCLITDNGILKGENESGKPVIIKL